VLKVFIASLIALPLLAQEVLLLRPTEGGNVSSEQIEERGKNGVRDRSIANVTAPSLTVYLPPKDRANGTAVVICPGGGYAHLAIDKEGHDIARWLNTLGVAGIVLKYRLPGSANMLLAMGDVKQAAMAAKVAIEDGEEAMRIVRSHAAKWNVNPADVGMMGFSAGGNLAVMVGMLGSADVRPNFLVLGYPAIPQNLEIGPDTPPAFIVQADDDRLAPANNSVRFYLALKKAHIPAEMHIYSGGGHGFGIVKNGKTSANWPDAFKAWLDDRSRSAPVNSVRSTR
jgi:acetyl esterase/lipase